MDEFHVAIVGAGITGLLLAQGLKKANIKYTVFESEPSAEAYRPRLWGLSIHWATPLLEKLLPAELYSRINEAQCDPSYKNPDIEHLNIYDATNGNKLIDMPAPHHIRFNRASMRSLSAEGIEVEYDRKLKSMERSDDGKTVKLAFMDGSYATCSMVVGADGTNSRVRHSLLGDEKAAATPASTAENPFVFTNVTVQYPKAEQALFLRKLHPTFYMGVHPEEGGVFWVSPQSVGDINDPTTWKFQLFNNWRGAPPSGRKNVLPELKEWAKKLADPWKSAIEWLPDDTVIDTQNLAYWHPIERDNWSGRVTLAGDAAHPMVSEDPEIVKTPDSMLTAMLFGVRGQGLGHCIADVSSLIPQLQAYLNGSKTLAEAITEYDTEVVARAGDEVNVSLKSMHFMMTGGPIQESPQFKRNADPNEAALKIIGQKPAV